MAKDVKFTENDGYAVKVFMNAVVPLLRVVAADVPKIAKKFAKKKFVFQMSALDDKADGGKVATYFEIDHGDWKCFIDSVHPKPDVEFEFSNKKKLILFMCNKNPAANMPKIRGKLKIGKLMAILKAFLTMAGLLSAKEIPTKLEDQKQLVKLYFYLLPLGISQLNKAGYKPIREWTKTSPDRIWALSVAGDDELKSWLRISGGNSKSGRGESKIAPFLCMEFDSTEHALGILMGQADMLDYLKKSYLKIDGAPEMAAQFGDHMFAVGDFAQGLYLAEQGE